MVFFYDCCVCGCRVMHRLDRVEEEQGAARCTAAGRVSQQLQRGERQELAAVELQQRELRIAPGRAQQRLREWAARGEVCREPQRRAARVVRHVSAKMFGFSGVTGGNFQALQELAN